MTFNPPVRLLTAYQSCFSQPPDLVLPVPGREMWIATEFDDRHVYTIITPDLDGRSVFDRRSAKQRRTIRNRPLQRWARYPAGVALILSEDGLDIPGGTMVIVGDEPSGPRYEHALGMAFAALCYAYHQQAYDVDLLLDIMERVQKHYLD